MERKLIKKLEFTDNILNIFVGFSPLFALFIPVGDILERFISNNILLVGLTISSSLIFYFIFLILNIFIALSLKKFIFKDSIIFSDFGLYKIDNNYYSNNWHVDLKGYSKDNIVGLNQDIHLSMKYFLVLDKKYFEINEKQYLELVKLEKVENKPLLKLNEDEFNNLKNFDIIETYSFC